jgi:dCTP deaminase
MSVVDLCRRATADWDAFNRCVRSSDSLIFFEKSIPELTDPPGSIDLCVGSRWFDPADNRFYAVEESGLQVKPHSCILIEVEQRMALPHNVMGIVIGKGKFIFRSALISTGKIDAGFDGKLRIGFQNASGQMILLKTGVPFCSCFFINTESEARHPRRNPMEPEAKPSPLPRLEAAKRWWADNWKTTTPILISIASLAVAIMSVIIGASRK